MTKKIYTVQGMTCASCAQTIEKALEKVSGVESAGVNFATSQASVEYNQANTDFAALAGAVQGTGYTLVDQSQKDGEFKVIGMGSDHCGA